MSFYPLAQPTFYVALALRTTGHGVQVTKVLKLKINVFSGVPAFHPAVSPFVLVAVENHVGRIVVSHVASSRESNRPELIQVPTYGVQRY